MFTALTKLVAVAALAVGVVLAVAAQQRGKLADASKEEKPAVDRHGDPLPAHAVARLGTLRFRWANSIVQAVAVPGGKQLLGLDFGQTVVLWDATGKEVRRFEAPAAKKSGGQAQDVSFQSLAVSPDGKTLAVGAKRTLDNTLVDCPLLLFDLATGRKIAEWQGHQSHGLSGYPLLAFVTPTLLVSAGDDGWVRLWDTTKQRELRRLALPDGSQISAIVPSPDRAQIFVAGRDVKMAAFWTAWEVATGKLMHREEGLPGVHVKLALSPDGASLGLAMGMARPPKGPNFTEIRLYSGPKWQERRRWQAHDGEDWGRSSIVFSPDGKTIATGGADGMVRRWDAVTGKEIGTAIDPCQKHCQNVTYLDADTLVTFGYQATAKFWDATTGQPKLAFAGSELQITALAYSPDGRHIALGGGDAPIRVWEAASGKQVAQLRDGMSPVSCLDFSPDGIWIASCDYNGGLRVWDWAKGGAPIKNISDPKSTFYSVAFSPDGKSIATGDGAGAVRVWAVSTGKLVHTLKGQTFEGQFSRVSALAFTADGRELYCSCSGLGIRKLNLATGAEVCLFSPKSLGHLNAVNGLAISPGGRWGYSAGYDGSICVWEAGTGRLARVLMEQKPGHEPGTIALSRDGTRLAAAFVNNREDLPIHLWDLTTGLAMLLKSHQAPVSQLAFSPDGRRLASGSYDTTALVWDVAKLGPARKIPDGKALAGLWKDLGADDPKVAYAAVCRGAAAGDAGVARLQVDLKPAVAMDAVKIAAWVRQLDADEFPRRQKATQTLADLGPAAEAILRAALVKAKSPEARQRLQQILAGQEAEHRRLGQAVELLEMIGTPAARRLLADLANGASGARLTREARVTLDRLDAQEVIIHVRAAQVLHKVSPHLTGACIEDVNHEIYGGIYSQMIFGESFQEPAASPPVKGFQSHGGQWDVRDGAIWVNGKDGPKLVSDHAVFKDGSAGVELFFADKKGQNAGLLVRVSKPGIGADNFVGYEVALDARRQILRLARHRHNFEPIKDVRCEVATGRWIPLEVKLTGSVVEILVDGKSVLKHDDGKQALAEGTVGLRPWHCKAGYRQLWVKTSDQVEVLPFRAETPIAVSGMWRPTIRGSAVGHYALIKEKPFAGSQSQRVVFASGEGEIGIENQGLNRWGQNFVAGKPYEGHVWVRSAQPTKLFAAMESRDGSKIYAEQPLQITAGSDWQRLEFKLTPTTADSAGRIALKLKRPGSVTIGQVFVQPGAWGRFKGLPVRRDVVEGLIGQGITVLRYGGSMVNNSGYRWKNMIGPRDRRPPYSGTWYKYSSNGWGILDFMNLCEAAGFECIPDFTMDETPQDMADFMDYITAPADTEWGRKRLADGHPEPYKLKYIQLGNEERVDEAYAAKFEKLATVIWAKNPKIILVVGDFAYGKHIDDPFRFDGAASGITNLTGHQRILRLAKKHDREVWFDVHVGTNHPVKFNADLDGMFSFADSLGKIAGGAKHKVVVFEYNAGNHAVKRALANALATNAVMRDGRIPIVASANCLQPDRQNDNGWDQGLLFLNPSKVWLQPPGYVTQMQARNYLPQLVKCDVTDKQGKLDVVATRSADGKTLVLSVVNPGEMAVATQIELSGFIAEKAVARVTTLSGPLDAVNTAHDPDIVIPRQSKWKHGITDGRTTYTFSPRSFTAIRLD